MMDPKRSEMEFGMNMNTDGNPDAASFQDEPTQDAPVWNPIAVEVGAAMPAATDRLPVLNRQLQGVVAEVDDGQGTSKLAEGITFTGDATLRGALSISGTVNGNVRQAEGARVAVVVTESGRLKGDIAADKISVMGQTDGLLDAGSGQVTLHDVSVVKGHVRYGRIQVNGADLNATLERVAPDKSVS